MLYTCTEQKVWAMYPEFNLILLFKYYAYPALNAKCTFKLLPLWSMMAGYEGFYYINNLKLLRKKKCTGMKTFIIQFLHDHYSYIKHFD